MIRLYSLIICLILVSLQLSAKEVAGVDMESLERPNEISLSSQEILKERRLKRDIRSALRQINLGELEAQTKDEFSKLLDKTIDRSDVRKAGEKKVAEGEARLKKAAGELQEIYAEAQARAELTSEARSKGLLHEWTSTDGRTLTASFVSLSSDAVTVMTDDGKEFAIPLKLLVKSDWSVAKILDSGRGFSTTGFLETIASGNTSELKYFIEAGYEPPAEIHGEAFLECIALEQSSLMLRLLIDYGLNVNSHSADGSTPLSHAVQVKKVAIVRTLLAADADPLLKDTSEPKLSPIVWSLHKWDPVISSLLFLQDEEKLGEFLASLSGYLNNEYFKPLSVDTAKKLQEIVDGKKIHYSDLQTFRLSLLGLEMTINDLEKVMIAKKLRPLVISYHTQDFYRHTIGRNQEYIDSILETWEEQHQAGEHAASYSLALAYLEGWGDLEDPQRAEDYLTVAIAGEHTASMILMGEIFETGLLGDKKLFAAYDLYRQAAGLTDPMGMVKLGYCFEEGISVDRDLSKAIVWYERAIENGSTEGMAQLGRCYLNGIGVEKNARLGLEWYSKAAEANNLSAMFFLGKELLLGNEVRKNTNEGLNWLKRAADFGEQSALLALGIAYSDGTVRTDSELANSYFKEAAEKGEVEAMYRFANNLQDGIGITKNEEEAFEWYEKAAENGHLAATNELAVCYSAGKGVRQNQRKAFDLFKEASSKGFMQATANLAVCYAKGLGVPVDEEKSTRLSLEVINSNDASAKDILKLLPTEK